MGLEKKILSPSNLNRWTVSSAYQEIICLIEAVSEQVKSKRIRPNLSVSKTISSLVNLLDCLLQQIDTFPFDEQPQRFGNKAYRSWHNWLCLEAKSLCTRKLLQPNGISQSPIASLSLDEAVDELADYLTDSFGNASRIDYGTGHELAFIAFLVCLFKLGLFQRERADAPDAAPNDLEAVGLVVMPVYLKLVRKLQCYYRMEPAGSHGVWCLDDFQFIPFIWGSSQLINHNQYYPGCISDRQIADREKDSFLFFSCIHYIYQVKTGPFGEHSPTLYGMEGVANFSKIYTGLIKMYKGEVLGKFPVVQHFLFGKLLTIDQAPTAYVPPPTCARPVHVPTAAAAVHDLPQSTIPKGPEGEHF